MKARIKSTGEIVEISEDFSYVNAQHFEKVYYLDELEWIDIKKNNDIDYWTKLKHQYAGMVMQSILQTMPGVSDPDKYMKAAIDLSVKIATALVEKLKEKEERK